MHDSQWSKLSGTCLLELHYKLVIRVVITLEKSQQLSLEGLSTITLFQFPLKIVVGSFACVYVR